MGKTTPEEIYNVYTFKLIKRMLKKKFPWIKDVFVRQDDLDKYTRIFLNFDFDPNEFSETYGFTTKPWIQEMIDEGKYLDFSYPNLINDMEYDDYRKVRDGIRSVINNVTDNPALPREYKFDNRSFDLGTWHINRNEGQQPFMAI